MARDLQSTIPGDYDFFMVGLNYRGCSMGKSSLAADSDFRHVRPITFQRASPTAMQKKSIGNAATVAL